MFITDLSCISPQKTYDNAFLNNDIVEHFGTRYMALEPSYGALIPAGLLRRMGKSVRMGVGAGLPLIQKHPQLDGIILGTANGGLEDCLKFLNQIVEYGEGTLTPTNFVQSTPNAIAGNLALMSKNTGYNTTHVHEGLAFECTILDALMLLTEQKAKALLIGSIDEISGYNYNINFLEGWYKKLETDSKTLLNSNSPGTVSGEGAAMFIVESELSKNSVAQILDVGQINYTTGNELKEYLKFFLEKNKIQIEDIDTLILGYNGDNRHDYWYSDLYQAMFLHSSIYSFKNLVGDYPTASGFATWLAVQILSGKQLPPESILSNLSNQKSKNILIYNHYKGIQHGFILLTAC